ncbi:hypothetical protein EYF80_056098 [Liparis tanakae]|uniref:Uncharacterized protein n=1 Tax=Liparis tanakae TaxID=230148 RepID=A0A4Z2EZR1_9TELE|nr:hypothetical protein EYF80_056098 [Liparis tanakae]
MAMQTPTERPGDQRQGVSRWAEHLPAGVIPVRRPALRPCPRTSRFTPANLSSPPPTPRCHQSFHGNLRGLHRATAAKS